MARQDIEFDAEGVTLRGWFYTPDSASGPAATVILSHGFTAVKEMYLDKYAELFAAAGLNALVFDHRNFGASDGQSRHEVDPWAQIRDYRHAITYAGLQPAVDENRIGVWGSSFSGAHVLVVSAIDRRVKAAVCQVPLISGHANFRSLVRSDLIAGFQQQFVADRIARYNGEAPAVVPVVAADGMTPCALPTADSYDFFVEQGKTIAPSWQNEVTLRSVEMFAEYEPISYVPFIYPTPLLIMPAAHDHLTPSVMAAQAYEIALEPKKFVLLPGGHFDAYTKGFDISGPVARDWFVKHLTNLLGCRYIIRTTCLADAGGITKFGLSASNPERKKEADHERCRRSFGRIFYGSCAWPGSSWNRREPPGHRRPLRGSSPRARPGARGGDGRSRRDARGSSRNIEVDPASCHYCELGRSLRAGRGERRTDTCPADRSPQSGKSST